MSESDDTIIGVITLFSDCEYVIVSCIGRWPDSLLFRKRYHQHYIRRNDQRREGVYIVRTKIENAPGILKRSKGLMLIWRL